MELVETFQAFRTIFSLCPCCNQIQRLSDLRLRYEGKGSPTWLDKMQARENRLGKMEETFAEKENGLRAQAAERGRLKVNAIITRSMVKELAQLKFNPYDIKPLMHPVDFVVFQGMNDGTLEQVLLLSRRSGVSSLSTMRKQIASAVADKKYGWKVARVGIDGGVEWE